MIVTLDISEKAYKHLKRCLMVQAINHNGGHFDILIKKIVDCIEDETFETSLKTKGDIKDD
jgi:hypothetical protein